MSAQSPLISLYRRHFGEAVRGSENASTVNGPCPFCGGRDRCVVWADKREGLGKVCMEHGVSGVFWCRQCGKGGDTLEFMTAAMGMDFKDALRELGIAAGSPAVRIPHQAPKEEEPKPFSGRDMADPSQLWMSHAMRMVEDSVQALEAGSTAAAWLARRGITLAMARRYQVGLLRGENGRDCRFRARSSFGLPAEFKADGAQKKLWIPRGITIPSFRVGEVVMFRVRRPNGDLTMSSGRDRTGEVTEKKGPKYWELPGGSRVSYHLAPEPAPAVSVYLIVESEFDAMLLHALAGEGIGVVGMRSASNRPDISTHAALKKADVILVALDSDKAGAAGIEWWQKTYSGVTVFPVPGYKDAGEAWEAGFDLRLWLESAMPRTLILPPPAHGAGTLEMISGRKDSEGGSGEAAALSPGSMEAASGVKKSERKAARFPERSTFPPKSEEFADLLRPSDFAWIRSKLPSFFDVDVVPAPVLAASVLWRSCHAQYRKLPHGGFEWRPVRAWASRNPQQWHRLLRLTERPEVGEWLAMHEASDIDGTNFLQLYGGDGK